MRRPQSAADAGQGADQPRPAREQPGPEAPGRREHGGACPAEDAESDADARTAAPAGAATEAGAGTGADDVSRAAAAVVAGEAGDEVEEEDGEVIAVVESDRQQSPVTPAVRGMAAWSWRFLVIVLAEAVAIVGLIQIKQIRRPSWRRRV